MPQTPRPQRPRLGDNVLLTLGIVALMIVVIFLIAFINGVDEGSSAREKELVGREPVDTPAPTTEPKGLPSERPASVAGVSVSARLQKDCAVTIIADNRSANDMVLGVITDTMSSELASVAGHRAKITFPMNEAPASVSIVSTDGDVLLVQPFDTDGCTPTPPGEVGAILGPAQELTKLEGSEDGT